MAINGMVSSEVLGYLSTKKGELCHGLFLCKNGIKSEENKLVFFTYK